jgi:hypothetical protein
LVLINGIKNKTQARRRRINKPMAPNVRKRTREGSGTAAIVLDAVAEDGALDPGGVAGKVLASVVNKYKG